jgi:NADPH:quinone reductase-like Zn-dependent oxidoreductase
LRSVPSARHRRLTGGRGADVILDAVGGPGFRPLGEAVAPGATMVLYGRLDPDPAHMPVNWRITVHGYAGPEVGRTLERRREAAHYIDSGLADGSLRPVIAEVFDGLDAIGDAHRPMESNRHTGKVVLRV